jgi:hypothetical protein
MLTYVLVGSVLSVMALTMALKYGGSVIRRRRGGSTASPVRDDASINPPAVTGADPDRAREEARLATALLAGDLPLVWYRHRMTELAARDDACHPLVVPPTGELPGDAASM